MHCELVIPGLFSAAADLRLPAAELLCARGRHAGAEPQPLEEWLFERFGMEADACPAGALTVLALGSDPGEDHWARADPVHLRLMRESVTLVPSEAFAISGDEALALCESLNEHFAGRLVLQALEPNRWVARLPQPMALPCDPPLQMAGQDVPPGRAGDVLVNELQMALHAHPVNEAREARGEPPVNSLWLWGAGRVPAKPEEASPWQSVCAADPLALGLARLSGARGKALPPSGDAWLDRSPEEGRHLAVLDVLRAPIALGDEAACRDRLQALEDGWLAPLLSALRRGDVGMVTLHVPDAAFSVEVIRGDLRRFWRRPRPIGRMAP